MKTENSPAYGTAFGGIMAALATTLMLLGALIPIATYIIPVLCSLMAQAVMQICGKRNGWAWFGAVAALGLLFCHDREATAVFLFIGYYPMVKPKLDSLNAGVVWKFILFNTAIICCYAVLLKLIGIDSLQEEMSDMSVAMFIVLLSLGNLTFWLMDKVLNKNLIWRLWQRGK